MIYNIERAEFQNKMMSLPMSEWEHEIYVWVSAYCHLYGFKGQVIFDSLGEYWNWKNKAH